MAMVGSSGAASSDRDQPQVWWGYICPALCDKHNHPNVFRMEMITPDKEAGAAALSVWYSGYSSGLSVTALTPARGNCDFLPPAASPASSVSREEYA